MISLILTTELEAMEKQRAVDGQYQIFVDGFPLVSPEDLAATKRIKRPENMSPDNNGKEKKDSFSHLTQIPSPLYDTNLILEKPLNMSESM